MLNFSSALRMHLCFFLQTLPLLSAFQGLGFAVCIRMKLIYCVSHPKPPATVDMGGVLWMLTPALSTFIAFPPLHALAKRIFGEYKSTGMSA